MIDSWEVKSWCCSKNASGVIPNSLNSLPLHSIPVLQPQHPPPPEYHPKIHPSETLNTILLGCPALICFHSPIRGLGPWAHDSYGIIELCRRTPMGVWLYWDIILATLNLLVPIGHTWRNKVLGTFHINTCNESKSNNKIAAMWLLKWVLILCNFFYYKSYYLYIIENSKLK